MAVQTNDLSETIVRIGKSLAIHLPIAAIVMGLIYWLTSNFTDASEDLRANYDPQAVMDTLQLVRSSLWEWLVIALIVSFLCSALFIAAAQRRHPRNPSEGASRKAMWVALMLAMLVATGVLWWLYVSQAEVQVQLMGGNYSGAVTLVGIGTMLAYYLSTALAVTVTMKPSVPASGVLPTFWN